MNMGRGTDGQRGMDRMYREGRDKETVLQTYPYVWRRVLIGTTLSTKDCAKLRTNGLHELVYHQLCLPAEIAVDKLP